MNIKHILTASAFALATSGAFASEATQFTDLGGKLSRAEVRADLSAAIASGALNRPSALYGSVDIDVASERSRAAVRDEARVAARSPRSSSLYLGG